MVTATQRVELTTMNEVMHQAGQAANQAAAQRTFEDHTDRKAENTIRRKMADLAMFETFLNSTGVPAAGLFEDPQTWVGVTWGLVEAFKVWQLQQGYAIGTITGRLSTVRTYAKLAAKAGATTAEESVLIVSGSGMPTKKPGTWMRNGARRASKPGSVTRKWKP